MKLKKTKKLLNNIKKAIFINNFMLLK